MQITGKGRIYKNQYGYTIADNQKQKDGTWNQFYIPVQFQKGLELPNDKDDIVIHGFTKPFKYKDGKVGISYFIMEWELQKKEAKQEFDPYAHFGNSIEVKNEDLDLPF